MFRRALIKPNTFPRDTVSFVELIKSEVAVKTETLENFIVENFDCFQQANPMTKDDINIKGKKKIHSITARGTSLKVFELTYVK